MSTFTLKVRPYFGGMFDPFTRCVYSIAAILVGGLLIYQGFVGTSDVLMRVLVCLLAFVVAGIALVLTFTYTELDETHVATVIRIGKLVRLEKDAVHWDEVRAAKLVRGSRPTTVSLELTMKDGRKASFSVSGRTSEGEASFDDVVRHFHNAAA
jgi:hypothetical protein